MTPSRHRVTFDAQPDVWKVVQPKGYGERKRYLNETVRRYENPPYWLRVPYSEQEGSITDFLEDARHEVIMTGMSLHHLVDKNRSLLESKVIDEQVAMTIITMRGDITERDPIYRHLLSMVGSPQFVDDIVVQIDQSQRFFRHLRDIGPKYRTKVDFLRCSEVPRFGLIVRDHNRRTDRMHINVYLNMHFGSIHPFIEINPDLEEGRHAYDAFYEYYSDLARRSREDGSETKTHPLVRRSAGKKILRPRETRPR